MFPKICRLLCLSCLCLAFPACQPKAYLKDGGEVFHTTYHITYQSSKDLHQAVADELEAIDASLSMFNPHSTLSAINRHDTTAIALGDDAWVCHLLGKALEISRLTDGAFDITVAPLVNLWGFGFKHHQTVNRSQVDSIREFVGYQLLDWQPESALLRKADARVQLDASAIAKGYACDIVGALLEREGVENYLVEIGGEIRMKGLNPKGKSWTVGIDRPEDDPLAERHQLQAAISLSDKGMATSGNYRNFYLKDGRRIAHTIDPASGEPVQHSLLSATVVAADCLTADALATSFMVLGLERAIQLLESHPEWSAYFIYSDEEGAYRTWSSPEIASQIRTME